MKKTKGVLKKYLMIFLIGMITGGSISVIAETYFPSNDVTYDNSVSGLQSTNVQGAIDELYNTCFPPEPPKAGDYILDTVDIVTSGDGLYKDEYEDGKYTYKGTNPNNYITFNYEKAGWRIISIEDDRTIKIIKTNSIGSQRWDTSGSNNWIRPSSLNTYLNETYYNGLNSTAKSQIVSKNFGIGAVKYNDTNLANTINDENSNKWNGKIALPTASEYVRSNSNQSNCGTIEQIYDSNSCNNTNWMNNNTDWWTLSPCSRYSDSVYVVYFDSGYFYENYADETSHLIRPALYISSEVKITGGTGTASDPYTIE